MKFHDVDLDDAVVATAGTITPSTVLIPQGTTESTRIGRKCNIKSIGWKFRLNLPEVDAAADPPAADTVRVCMFLDKQCNGATATVTDILEVADFQSFNNLANKSRFNILYNKVFTLNPMTLASNGAGVMSSATVQRNSSFYKQCNLSLEFSGVTGALTEIRSNNIGVLLISSNGVAAFASKLRFRFDG